MKHPSHHLSFNKIIASVVFVFVALGISFYFIGNQNKLLTQIAGTGTIQGITVKYGDGTIKVPTTITINGVGSRSTTASNNSYSFSGLTSGTVYTISVTVPPGWTNPRFNYCLNAVGTCHNTATVWSGNTLALNVPAGGYYDLWWYFDPVPILSLSIKPATLNFESTLPITPVPAFPRSCANATIFARTDLSPKAGLLAFKFSGTDDCAGNNSHVYYKIADANIPITENTVLEYKIAPQNPFGLNVGVDLLLDNGQYLRDQDIYSDDAILMHPAYQSKHSSFVPCCPVSTLKTIKVNLGKLRGRIIKQIIVGYDDASNTQVGPFDARIDDIKIYDVAPFRKFALGQSVVSIASVTITKDISTGQLASATKQQTFEQGTVIDGPIPVAYLKNTAGVNIPGSNMLWRIDFTSNLLSGSSDTSTIDGWIRENYLQSNTPAQVSAVISASTNPCNNGIKGDMDCSGPIKEAVTVTDGVIVLRCAAGLSPCSAPPIDPDIIKQGDMDCDYKITVTDGVNVLRKAAGLSVSGCVSKKWKDIIDFNGDGKSDILAYGNGSQYVMTSLQNGIYDIERLGSTYGRNFPVDWDYDGKADMANLDTSTGIMKYKPSTQNWNTDLQIGRTYTFDSSNETIVLGDYNSDGSTDFVAWNRYTGNWRGLPGGDKLWGDRGTIPVPGDYDGDGKTDLSVWRPSTGSWDVLQSSNGAVVSKQIGDQASYPAQADYDGDGKTDRAVFRKSNLSWVIYQSSDGAIVGYTWPNLNVMGCSQSSLSGDFDGDGKADYAYISIPCPGTGVAGPSSVLIRRSSDGVVVRLSVPYSIYKRDWFYPTVVVPPTSPTPLPCPKLGIWKAEYSGGRVDCIPVSTTGDLLLKETFSQISKKVPGGWEGSMVYTTRANFATANPILTITHGNVTTKVSIDGVVQSTQSNNLYVTQIYDVTLNVTPGEHTLQIHSSTDGASGINGYDVGIEVHGPRIWGDGGSGGGGGGGGGGAKGTPAYWGGTGIGASPVLGALMVETYINASEVYLPRYPIVYVDGKPIQQTNDLSLLQSLSVGHHTLSVERMSGFDIWMSLPCVGCFNHPLSNFVMTDAIGFDYDGSTFLDFAIQYFPAGRSLEMTWFANTTDGRTIQGGTVRTSESGILFQNFWQVIRNLFTIPRQYISAIVHRYFEPLKANAYQFLAKWQGCNIPGHNIVPQMQLDFGKGEIPIEIQISNANDEWRKAVGFMMKGPVLTDKDYARGALDHTGVMAYIDDNFVIPALGMSIVDAAPPFYTVSGIALLWNETGDLLARIDPSPDIVVESDILINASHITTRLSDMQNGVGIGYFQNAITHEYGHHIGLGHSSLSDNMKAGGAAATYIKTVGSDDVSGAHALYQGCF